MKEIAQQFLRALRGPRSQQAFARRLRYRSNVATDWEAGRRFPTALEMFVACGRLGLDVRAVLNQFHPCQAVEAQRRGALQTDEFCQWLAVLRGQQTLQSVAERGGFSRFTLSRWFCGRTQPRLPEFFRLVDTLTSRLPDLIGLCVDLRWAPELEAQLRLRQELRELAFREPWSEAIMRVLETTQYAELPAHVEGWVANYLGISRQLEERCLAALCEVGAIAWRGQHYKVDEGFTIDTRMQSERYDAVRHQWAQTPAELTSRLKAEDVISYNVFSCSLEDMHHIGELQKECFHHIRSIIAASKKCEAVALLQWNLLRWPR